MARSTAIFFSGTLPSDPGGDQVHHLIGVITASMEATQTGGQNAFILEDLIDPTSSSFDGVWHSVGDKTLAGVSGSHQGDTDIWFRMRKNSATEIRFTTYQDWSPASSDTTTSFTTNPGGDRSSTSTLQGNFASLSATDELQYWACGNEYEFAFVFVQGGLWHFGYWGGLERNFVSPGHDGVARILTTLTGSGNVTIELDRNVSGSVGTAGTLAVGQRILMVPQTPSGSTLVDSTIDIVTIDKVMSSSDGKPAAINVSTTSKVYDSGSILGVDPNPTYNYAGTTNANTTPYFPHSWGGTHTVNVSTANWTGIMSVVTEGDHDPNTLNFYLGSRPIAHSAQLGFTGPRGITSTIAFFPIGAQLDGDRMIVGNQFYFAFPSITFSSHCLAMGPLDLP